MSASITKPLLGDKITSEMAAADHLPLPEKIARVKAAVLSDPVIANATTPLPWYKSQSIWGNIATFVGGLAIAAPQIANLFPEWSDPILKYGGLLTLVIGVWNGVSGRVSASRPIGSAQ